MKKAEGLHLVEQKVADFHKNEPHYLSKAFQETETRNRFIDPLFQALGWDFEQTHLPRDEWDVHREYSQKERDTIKKPDYAFRVKRKPRFFVEAKAPHVPLTDKRPVFQAKKYAFSSHGRVPVIVITDFQEFRVFNAYQKPLYDNPLQGLIKDLDLAYTQYPAKWDLLWDTFSKEAVLGGSIDLLAKKVARNTKTLDDEFLTDLTAWRELLARNIAVRNPQLSADELNECVQRILDRFIFIRNLEDREIEHEDGLATIAETREGIYPALLPIFRTLDAEYNGLLFKKHLSEDLTVDDEVLKKIIKAISPRTSPYQFDIIEPEILGRIYERFLGSKIRLTEGHRAKVEEKPEVRHAGGVYYTPQWVVDYIVANTVGTKLWGYAAEPNGKCLSCGKGGEGRGARDEGLNAGDGGCGTRDEQRSKGGKDGEGNQELQGSEGMGRGNAACDDGLQHRQAAAGKRKVQSGGSDDQGSRIRSCEHCGRSWIEASESVPESSVSESGIAHGIGNASSDLRSPGLSQGQSSAAGSSASRQSLASNERPDSVPKPSAAQIPGDEGLGARDAGPHAFKHAPRPTPLTPEEASRLRILDPACGSGSFLLGAFDYLVQYHEQWYGEHKKDKAHARDWYQTAEGDIRLTVEKKGRILKNNLFGVDLDREATEVAIMSLYLKLLDKGFDKGQMMLLMKGTVLPDLTANIKCGNSLIGQDFYQGRQMDMFTTEERTRINAFDWDREFACIMKAGGFDVVIGNPPYVRQETLGDDFKEYAKSHFKTFAGTADLYTYFIERGISLLKEGGQFGYIVANKWMRAAYGKQLREWLKDKAIEELVDFGDLPVFQGATTYPCILRVSKGKAKKSFSAAKVPDLGFSDLAEKVKPLRYTVDKATLSPDGWSLADSKVSTLLEKIKAEGIPLKKYVKGKIYYGIKTGFNEAFVIDEATRKRLIKEDPKSAELIKPFLQGRDIKRYQPPQANRWLILIPNGFTRGLKGFSPRDAWTIFQRHYPALAEHFSQYDEPLKKRWDKGEYPWELRPCDYYSAFQKPKIIYPDIAAKSQFTLAAEEIYMVNTLYFIPSDDLYLLGVLNSKPIEMLIQSASPPVRGGYYRYFSQYIEELPIKQINPANNKEMKAKEEIITLVDQLLKLNAEVAASADNHQRELISRRISNIESIIDQATCSLYGIIELANA